MVLNNVGRVNYIPSNRPRNCEGYSLAVYADGRGSHFVKWQGRWFRVLRVADIPTARGGNDGFLTWLGEDDLAPMGEDWQWGLERALAVTAAATAAAQ